MLILRVLACVLAAGVLLAAQSDWVNWETPPVHPLELTPDGARLLVANTADGRLEIFDVTGPAPVWLDAVRVGLEPVSVRARTATEVWVVNHLSDSISIVDLTTRAVIDTVATADEPCDVVFVPGPPRAFVSCSQDNLVQVFAANNPTVPMSEIVLDGEDPRSLAVSPDGATVYAAIFESGNGTTILSGPILGAGSLTPGQVAALGIPHGGQIPPPNAGTTFDPPLGPGLPTPPATALIVRHHDDGAWRDDNDGDWTSVVSGPFSYLSERIAGWQLRDDDLAVIDATTLTVSYVGGLMNACATVAVDPATGAPTVIGTRADNEIRFEPVLRGRFVREVVARVNTTTGQATVSDLNPHLDYTTASVAPAARALAVGIPRDIVWSADGSHAWIAGMGSNNVVTIDSLGMRLGATIEVGEGPAGLALDDATSRLYVLNRFEGTLSVIDTVARAERHRVRFFDPAPAVVRRGRRVLYGTHETSGLGQAACASCHLDARTDRLAWDLGDPAGQMRSLAGQNLAAGEPTLAAMLQDFHPMKGPMLTQTLQDVVGKEPHHWRGDRSGIAEFSGAFVSLLGADVAPGDAAMRDLEDYLATIRFPPNPHRELDNSLPTDLPLPGHFTTGRFAPPGLPLPNGDATRGLDLYRPPTLIFGNTLACVTCHTLPTGISTDHVFSNGLYQPIPVGSLGEHHHALFPMAGSAQTTFKVPQLRNLYERVGLDYAAPVSAAGFGFLHDGTQDTLAKFLSLPFFGVQSDQDVADLLALLLSFAGSDLPEGSTSEAFEPPGTPGLDTHAAVGTQLVLDGVGGASAPALARFNLFLTLADAGHVGIVATAVDGIEPRSYAYEGGLFRSDRAGLDLAPAQLVALASPATRVVATVVVAGTEGRIGVDRDGDGHGDGDERDAGSDPASALSTPANGKGLPPALATALSATASGYSWLHLSWSFAGPDPSNFTIERARDGSTEFTRIIVSSGAARSFTDAGLACDTDYEYRITARSAAGDRGFSAVRGHTGSCPTGPLMHVQSIHFERQATTGFVSAALVRIADEHAAPVGRARVQVTWTVGAIGATTTATGTTGDDGTARFLAPGGAGPWILVVDSLVHATVLADRTADVRSSLAVR